MLHIHPVGILALIALAMCWILAVVLYRVGTAGSVARKLSVLLVIEGLTLISTGYIDLIMGSLVQEQSWYPMLVTAESIIHTFGDCAMLALYPPFLAAALNTPMTRPFANKRVQTGITGAAVLLFFAVYFTPLKFGATLLYILLSLLFGFALLASIQAWRAAKGAARSRARSFALAFGVRDVCWGLVYAGATWTVWQGTYSVVEVDATGPEYIVYALGTLIAVPLVAYGILRTQLFDIDLRIRWTIKQSTVAGVFVAVMFVISEGVSQFLSDELGKVTGLLAAGILMFFLAPLQRFAERVASAAMPNTQNTPEYAAFRKMQVYETAVADAQQDGGISPKERNLLNLLRDSLDISLADAQRLESELSTRKSSKT
jgi:hypothetical protein